MAGPIDRGGQPDHHRPAELRHVGPAEGRQAGQGERERAEPGQAVEPGEDERADAGRHQAGHEHKAHHGPAQPGGLHQQERAGERRAEQRAYRGEAARGTDHPHPLLGHLAPPGEPGGQHREPAAKRDQRHLRPEHGAEGERGERRREHAGQLRRARRRMHGEAARRGDPARARQVPDGEPGEHPAGQQHRQRPPGRRGGEAQPVRQVREQFLLQVADQGEEAVRGRGHGHAENRRHDEQPDVGGIAQLRRRVALRRRVTVAGHHPIVLPPPARLPACAAGRRGAADAVRGRYAAAGSAERRTHRGDRGEPQGDGLRHGDGRQPGARTRGERRERGEQPVGRDRGRRAGGRARSRWQDADGDGRRLGRVVSRAQARAVRARAQARLRRGGAAMRLRREAQQLVLHGARAGRCRDGGADDRGGGRTRDRSSCWARGSRRRWADRRGGPGARDLAGAPEERTRCCWAARR